MLTPLHDGYRTRGACTWPDDYLDHWGDVYLAHPQIRARGVLFDSFLTHPVQILTLLGLPLPPCSPILPYWVERRIASAEREGACVGNGTLGEKMRHRRYPRVRGRSQFRVEG